MKVLIFDNSEKAEEKAIEILKSLPVGFEYVIQKKMNSEEYFIVGFNNKNLSIQLTFLNNEWYANHLDFEDVRGFSHCPMGAIKSVRESLSKKIKEYEEELRRMKESKEKDWIYGLN